MEESIPVPPRKLARTKSQLHTDHLRDELASLLEQARTLRVRALQVGADTEHVQRQVARLCTHDDGYSELEHCSAEQRSELQAVGDEVLAVLSTIKVDVAAARDGGQAKCFQAAMGRVEGLEAELLAARRAWSVPALDGLSAKILPLLNACSPEPTGIIDSRFQSTVLGMTLLDQKLIRGRLSDLIEDVERLRDRVAANPDAPPAAGTSGSEPTSSPSPPSSSAASPKPTWSPPPPPPAPAAAPTQTPAARPREYHPHVTRPRRHQASPAYTRQPAHPSRQPVRAHDPFGDPYANLRRPGAFGYAPEDAAAAYSRRRQRQRPTRDLFGFW